MSSPRSPRSPPPHLLPRLYISELAPDPPDPLPPPPPPPHPTTTTTTIGSGSVLRLRLRLRAPAPLLPRSGSPQEAVLKAISGLVLSFKVYTDGIVLHIGRQLKLGLIQGPEIWDDTMGGVDIFIAGIGTGGTITGAGRFLKKMNSEIKIIGVEPAETSVVSGENPGYVPSILDVTLLDEVVKIGTGFVLAKIWCKKHSADQSHGYCCPPFRSKIIKWGKDEVGHKWFI